MSTGGSCKKHNLKKDWKHLLIVSGMENATKNSATKATDNETCESDEVYASKCYWDNMDQNNKCKHRPS